MLHIPGGFHPRSERRASETLLDKSTASNNSGTGLQERQPRSPWQAMRPEHRSFISVGETLKARAWTNTVIGGAQVPNKYPTVDNMN